MKDYISSRVYQLAEHILGTKHTVRQTAALFGISKSTVHKDVTERLQRLNPELYKEVASVLAVNLMERHIRGGNATKRKFRGG